MVSCAANAAGAALLLCTLFATMFYLHHRMGAAGARTEAHSAPGQVQCTDKNEQCTAWKHRGQCEKNRAFMRQQCALSCAFCVAPPSARSFYPAWRKQSMNNAEQLVHTYVREHARSIIDVVNELQLAKTENEMCSGKFVLTSFGNYGVGNDLNTVLTAVAVAIISNRTFLFQGDGMHKYFGKVRWPEYGPVRTAMENRLTRIDREWYFKRAPGKRAPCPQSSLNLHPEFRDAFEPKKGNWGSMHKLLCSDFTKIVDNHTFYAIDKSLNWIIPLLRENKKVMANPLWRERANTLFAKGVNWAGLAYEVLFERPHMHPLVRQVAKMQFGLKGNDTFPLVLHLRHQDNDRAPKKNWPGIEANAIKCAGSHVRSMSPEVRAASKCTMFMSTDSDDDAREVFLARLRVELPADATVCYFDPNAVDAETQKALYDVFPVQNTSDSLMRKYHPDWGSRARASKRWIAVIEAYLLSRSDRIIGTVGSTFSEITGAIGNIYKDVYLVHALDRAWETSTDYAGGNTIYGESCRRTDDAYPMPLYSSFNHSKMHQVAQTCPVV